MEDDTIDRLKAALAERYAIERELGSGAMATVYLAEDLKHHRKVAVKVLKPDLAAALGAERFLREIEIAAKLTHPHILPLYDSGEAGGFLFYVMPYVEGESLRDRLNREKQLPIDEALKIASEVADALGSAHRHDVIHRDIKPENILLEEGHAVIADFGVAKAITAAGETRLTETGIAVGTPAYLSPEQAAGESELDGRSDVYALGCVLYEMLAGEPPFTGPTTESMVHQHLTADPPSVTNIRPAVPAHIAGTIARALAKTPADRFSPAAQFAEALRQATPTAAVATPGRARWLPAAFAAVTLAMAVVVAIVVILRPGGRSASSVPEPRQITFRGDLKQASLSPDGDFVAYVARGTDAIDRLLVQEIGGGEPIEIHTHEFLCCVQWSPDGSQVLFRSGTRTAGRTLLLPRLGGGTPRELNSEIITAWSADGSRIVSWWPQARELLLTNVTSGDTTGSIALDWPHVWVWGVDWSPGGDQLAVITDYEGTATLWAIPLGAAEPIRVLEDTVRIASPRWSPQGGAVYYLRAYDQQSVELRKIRLLPDGRPSGDPVRVLSAMPVGGPHESIPALSISRDGTRLLYLRESGYSNLRLVDVVGGEGERSVQQRPLTTGTAQRSNPRFSPEGDEVAFVEAAAAQSNIYVISIDRGTTRQLTFQENEAWAPAWAPDGSRIAYGSGVRDSMKVRVVDRDGGTPRVFAHTQFDKGNRLAWAPALNIVYQIPDDQNLHMLDPVTEDESPLISGSPNGWQYNPRPSPDGSQVAVWWNRTDSLPDGIWLISTTDGSPRFLVEGFHPLNWNARGDALFAMPTDPTGSPASDIFLVPLSGRQPELFVTLPFSALSRDVDITPDGRRIVAAVEESQADAWMVVNFDPDISSR